MAKKKNGLKIIVLVVIGFFLLFTILSAFSFLFSGTANAPTKVDGQIETSK